MNTMLSDHFAQQNCFVPLQKCDLDILTYKGSTSTSIKQTQFPLMLSWKCTIHKVQGLSLKGCVRYIFASLFCISKREHFRTKEKCLFYFESSSRS